MKINKKALHKKTFERMEKEVPQSRAHLGGYHTGKRDAYLNVIADLQSGEFDSPSDSDQLREELEQMKKERNDYREVLEGYAIVKMDGARNILSQYKETDK